LSSEHYPNLVPADLYQLHRINPKVPAEDQLGTLKDLQAEGKIKHIGLSEVSVRQIQHAQTIAPIVSVQPIILRKL
jgi:pyridoxine 4-dehydrogenase